MPGPTLEAFLQLIRDHAALIDAAVDVDPQDVAAVARLRKQPGADAQRVALTLQLAQARRAAASKFSGRHTSLLALPEAVEQASSLRVAQHKAKRFAETFGSGRAVADLCCGLGGDSMGLNLTGLKPFAVDTDPLRAWMASRNADCLAAAADATSLNLKDWPIHADPGRRDARGRVFRLADYQPGPEAWQHWAAQSPGLALKLSPAVDLDELAEVAPPGEVECISEDGRLVQAVLWTGRLTKAARTATLLTRDQTHTLVGAPALPGYSEPNDLLFTVDPSIERAGLIPLLATQTGLTSVHPKLGLLTGPDVIDSPWLTAFELVARLPWRPNKVRDWLHAHDGGLVEVKTRGKAVDPDAAQKQLRGSGSTRYTVFVLRLDRPVEAWVTRRVVCPG